MVPVGGVGVAITTEQERIEAAFHEGTLAFAWASPAERPTAGTHERFEWIAGLVARRIVCWLKPGDEVITTTFTFFATA
jgi:hypothetical protein